MASYASARAVSNASSLSRRTLPRERRKRNTDKLTPAEPEDRAAALAFGLRFHRIAVFSADPTTFLWGRGALSGVLAVETRHVRSHSSLPM